MECKRGRHTHFQASVRPAREPPPHSLPFQHVGLSVNQRKLGAASSKWQSLHQAGSLQEPPAMAWSLPCERERSLPWVYKPLCFFVADLPVFLFSIV